VPSLEDIARRLSAGSSGRSEADMQADVQSLLLEAASLGLVEGDLEVFLEAPVGGGKRIDVEAGAAIIEVKKTVRPGRAFDAAIEQLAGYVSQRSEELSRRYVGVLTDGQIWILFQLLPTGKLVEATRTTLRDARDASRLVAWLEVVLATSEDITPTPQEIVRRLGADSPAARLDLADLRSLYVQCRANPEVQVKRELWARLLLSALGTSFEDSDELFVTHTYLVLTAELIAHEIMGLPTDLASTDPRKLLEGQQFAMAGLNGVVEADFFDWPAIAPKGGPVIAAIARRLSCFDWSNVEHDVLKALYQSIIDPETRRRLGEYYTPDWLAQKIVAEHFSDPLNQRLLDPACGSGTFLFWAIRRLLDACESAGLSNREALERTVAHVQGMDLHPVAVTLARGTYLLALTPSRLVDRDDLTVPVFLGDSVRWEQDSTLRTDDGIRIRTADPLELVDDELQFPEGVLEEPQRFDRLVSDLARKAADRRPGSKMPAINRLLNRHGVREEDREAVALAFRKLCRLHDDGRDHVWSYYIRNLARPLSFTRPDGQVDLLVGNPPWLAYRSMPKQLQATYRMLAEQRGLWAGGKVASHQDLSDLFVSRAVEQYLKPGGSFSFVMPYAVLSRRQYAGFRTGSWDRGDEGTQVVFGKAEGFAKVKPPLFPMPSCVVVGVKADRAVSLPGDAIDWIGRVSDHQLDWPDIEDDLEPTSGGVATASDGHASPYGARFRQGAVLVPRMLLMVEKEEHGKIGISAGKSRVKSSRSSNEKAPWKELPPLNGVVEARFLRSVHLGSTIVGFRSRAPRLAVIPEFDGELLDGADERIEDFPGLAEWWRRAESVWEDRRSDATRLTLNEQIDYQGKLTKQFPIAPHRVVYTASGQHLAACRIEDSEELVEKALYWGAVDSVDEGRYVCAILNSDRFAEAVRPLQARGQHNPRHFDMHVFAVAFPQFDPEERLHSELAALAARAEDVVAAIEFDPDRQFQLARRQVRDALRNTGLMEDLDDAVEAALLQKKPSGAGRPSQSKDFLDALSASEVGRRKRRPRPRRKSRIPWRSSKVVQDRTDQRV
jgi:hypothetical protein